MNKRWSKHHDSCACCGTTERKHNASGLCGTCYTARRRPQKTRYAWSLDYEHCRSCGTQEHPHKAKGLCSKCYASEAHRISGKSHRVFMCEYCGKEFSPSYKVSPGRSFKFCSEECIRKGKGKRGSPFASRQELEQALVGIIKAVGQYLPKQELCKLAGTSTDTFDKYKLSVIALHKVAGVRKRGRYSAKYVSYFLLKDVLPDLEPEKTFEDCVAPTGKRLKFDFYSERHRLLIEVDGEHHRWDTQQEVLLRIQEYDRLKEQYAVEKELSLLRIPVKGKQRITLEYLMGHLKPYIV